MKNRRPLKDTVLLPGRAFALAPPLTNPGPTIDAPMDQSGERPTLAGLQAAELERSVGRYTYATKLGEGGMAEVHLCEDQRIRRQVAMKVMRRDRAKDAGARARFLREVSAQGQLEHPAIVPVYDAATDADGAPYFTMRRVRGPTLEEVLEGLRTASEKHEREYSRHRLLSAFGSVCLAVHYAHENGVVHCDLKPANVMLGSYGEVYVLDWGLAMRVGDTTDPNWVSGTPGFMAPEQIRGETPAPSADVYALGSILYEVLTLEPMFETDGALALFRKTLHGAVPRPSVRAPQRDVPPELEAIWERATALDPADRYPSVRALYDDLERYLAGDRDLALRRAMSCEHTATAAAIIERLRTGGAGEAGLRSDALRAVGQALAFDPDNSDAVRLLAHLLTEPPRDMPREATDEMNAAERASERVRSRAGAIGFLAIVPLVPIMLWLGVRNMPVFALVVTAWLAAAAFQIVNARRPRPDGHAPIALPLVAAFAIAGSSALMGPLVFTPTLATVFTLGFTLAMHPRWRFIPLAAGCLSIVVPQALQWAHVMPRSYVYENGTALILPFMTNLSENGGVVFMFMNLTCVAVAFYFGARVQANLRDMQRRVYVNAWQLRQLLPTPARPASTPPAANA
jgi:eukaryotic-like serine/threonine-protein kinase